MSNENAGGHTVRYDYDAAGRLLSATDPKGQSWVYGYDGHGRVASETTLDGRTTTYAYTTDNRLRTETRPDGSTLVETLSKMEVDIRLLVLGKHDEHLGEHVGSRIERVVRTMHQPILVTRRRTRHRNVSCWPSTTRKGVEMVARSPLFRGLQCHVVMVAADNADHRAQLQWATQTLQAAGFAAPGIIAEGPVERTLCDYLARYASHLVIMGAYGHSVIRGFLVGSTTTGMLRNAVAVLPLR